MIVPNQFPKVQPAYRLAFVGEAPGADEAAIGEPFVGTSGRLLRDTINKLGFAPHECFIGNVCQVQPPDNEITSFDPAGPEISDGRRVLFDDLTRFEPNVVCLLGQTALSTFTSQEFSISDYRGSLFCGDKTPCRWKCIATHHPARVQRTFGLYPLFKHDIKRARDEANTADLRLPQRTLVTRPSLEEALRFIDSCYAHLTAFDIEGWADHIGVSMISLSYDPLYSIVIPFWIDGKNYWSEYEEALIWKALAKYLGDPNAPKVCQNGLYEYFVLLWKHKVIIRGIVHDTMFAHWELFPEFEKNLGLQTSLYTREPYYKEDRESDNTETKLEYSAKDSAVTLEIIQQTSVKLLQTPVSEAHYKFNVDLIEPYTYIHLRGCRLSMDALQTERIKAESTLKTLSEELNQLIAPSDFHIKFPKALKQYGGFNVKSTHHKKWFLYEFLGYKPYTRYGQTTKEEVILKYRAKEQNPSLTTLFRATQCRTRISDLGKLTTNEDGRIRCSYNPVGSNTGRLNSTESNAVICYTTKTGLLKREGTGTNLQNVTEDARICFVPDNDDYYFFQCDLSGADGWTVAADLAALGHPTMLDDYNFGIKPAKVLLLLLEAHERGEDPGAVNRLDRPELLRRTDAIDTKFDDGSGRPRGWKYLCMKRVQHGTNYGAQPETVATTIFKDSEGAIDLSKKEAGLYQWLYRLRYNPDAREKYVVSELAKNQFLTAACGIRRRFFDIRNPRNIEPAIVRAALSFEPQANTTWATNAALRALYYDPENRNSQGHLFVEPLLQIHDALAGQFKKKHLAWVRRKMPGWFNNPLTIHGVKITIPYEGKIGRNWKELDEDL